MKVAIHDRKRPMTRYKGRTSLKVIESKFPHHIDMLVPEGGLAAD